MQLVASSVVLGVGVVLVLRSTLGADGYSMCVSGLSRATGLPFAVANAAVGLVLVAVAAARGVRPGPGTLVQPLVVGLIVQAGLAVVGVPPRRWRQAALLAVASLPVLALGVAGYLGTRTGAGPPEAATLAFDPPVPFRVGYGAAPGGPRRCRAGGSAPTSGPATLAGGARRGPAGPPGAAAGPLAGTPAPAAPARARARGTPRAGDVTWTHPHPDEEAAPVLFVGLLLVVALVVTWIYGVLDAVTADAAGGPRAAQGRLARGHPARPGARLARLAAARPPGRAPPAATRPQRPAARPGRTTTPRSRPGCASGSRSSGAAPEEQERDEEDQP